MTTACSGSAAQTSGANASFTGAVGAEGGGGEQAGAQGEEGHEAQLRVAGPLAVPTRRAPEVRARSRACRRRAAWCRRGRRRPARASDRRRRAWAHVVAVCVNRAASGAAPS